MKVPTDIVEDAFIPIWDEYKTLKEQILKRNEHWARLKRAKLDCPDKDHFPTWLEETHGIKVHMSMEAMITDDYSIVDEPKYTLFLLKYGQ